MGKLDPTDLKINALVTIAELNDKSLKQAKPRLVEELKSLDQYFGIQSGAKEQRRAIGGFLEVLDIYYKNSDQELTHYLSELVKYAKLIPHQHFKARAMCHLGFVADKHGVILDKAYLEEGRKIAEKYAGDYASSAGSCAYWLNKAGQKAEAQVLIPT